MKSVAIIGGGAWGVALALAAHAADNAVHITARQGETLNYLTYYRESPHLAGVNIPHAITISDQLPAVDAIVLAVPAQALRATLQAYAPHIAPHTPLIIAAKGYEIATGASLSAVAREVCPHGVPVLLSGPSFAADVARNQPTAVVLAAQRKVDAESACVLFNSANFRPYWSVDMAGVALGGALKNVYAIAAGLVVGMGLGESARAGLLARSFAELLRLGAHMGAMHHTLHGLSGFGDLVLTATSTQSRNYRFGLAIGGGASVAHAQAEIGLVEGVHTAHAFGAHAATLPIDMPILMAIYAIVAEKTTPHAVMKALLARPLKAEHE